MTVLGVLLVSVGAGAGTGLGAAVVTGEAHHLWELTAAQLNMVPAALVALGVAAALYGLAPRAVAFAWVVVSYGLLVSVFGDLLDLPRAAFVPQMPLEGFAATPLVVLTAVAAGLGAVGLLVFGRREISTT